MDGRALLRHSLAALAYRGGKTLRDAPEAFANFDTGGGQTPLRITAHLGDLLDWALSMAKGKQKWVTSEHATLAAATARFHASLAEFDAYLASPEPIHADLARLVAGPIADAFTHVGQLAMLRRMAGAPIRGENYFAADIATGRVGPDQAPPAQPFK